MPRGRRHASVFRSISQDSCSFFPECLRSLRCRHSEGVASQEAPNHSTASKICSECYNSTPAKPARKATSSASISSPASRGTRQTDARRKTLRFSARIAFLCLKTMRSQVLIVLMLSGHLLVRGESMKTIRLCPTHTSFFQILYELRTFICLTDPGEIQEKNAFYLGARIRITSTFDTRCAQCNSRESHSTIL